MKTGIAKATLGNTTLAETTSWHEVEGNVYFPPESIKGEFFEPTDLKTVCSWKGEASYYTVKDGSEFSFPLWHNKCIHTIYYSFFRTGTG